VSNYLEDTPTFGKDGTSIAYRARRGQKDLVVCNDRPGETFDFISGRPVFSPSTGRLVYAASASLKEYVVVDGARSEPFDHLWSPIPEVDLALMWKPAFSADGRRVVFGALTEGQFVWRGLPA
jgi:hypothetical protein